MVLCKYYGMCNVDWVNERMRLEILLKSAAWTKVKAWLLCFEHIQGCMKDMKDFDG